MGIKSRFPYRAMDRTSHDFLPLVFDVFGGIAPRAVEFIHRIAGLTVTKKSGISGGPQFNEMYSADAKSAMLCRVTSAAPSECLPWLLVLRPMWFHSQAVVMQPAATRPGV